MNKLARIMLPIPSRTLFIIIFLIPVLSLLLAGCNRVHVIPPPPQLFIVAPEQITADDLYGEFRKDLDTATAKHKDKEIWVIDARVDAFIPDTSSSVAISSTAANIVYNNKWLFNTFHSDQKFEVGDIVEFIGTCRGTIDQSIMIDIQWISKTGVSTSTTTVRSGY
jgi:hypothetical protein